MSETVSVVIPVKDGERHLAELLDALRREAPDEVLVIDSGSGDRSVAIARDAGASVLEIPPGEFGHGRTRNMGAERARGNLIAFLTQDATPVEGWLAAYREAFASDESLGVAFGPHLPREDTSPSIARELTEFFASLPDDEPFLSNVNACYRRDCWAEVRFREVPYAEDQAFGRDLRDTAWRKRLVRGAAVLHAHDYGPLEFMRRYFDEYRGLRETAGHVEPLALRSVASQVAADRAWMRERGSAGGTARSVLHHAGRRVGSALGSRAARLPAPMRSALSLEGRSDGAHREPEPVPAQRAGHEYEAVLRLRRDGPAPLRDAAPGMADRDRLHIAVVIPPFRVGSGGHNTIFQVTSRLERMGHTCSIWVHDPLDLQDSEWPAVIRGAIRDHFAPVEAPVHKGFADWRGADVVMATGWQTAHPVMMLQGCRARAYFVNDHEAEFEGTSFESALATETYGLGMHCIAASPWLRDLLIERYGASATDFQLGVDHGIYRPRPVERRRDTVVMYARPTTPRRAVPLGTLALEELRRRRPDLRIVLYGESDPPRTAFPYETLGVCSHDELARLYSEATVGISISMTNFSLIPKEMLACGLPCVELAGVSAESIFGPDGGPLELAPLDPLAFADAAERLLDHEALWERRSREGIDFVRPHTWDTAAEQTERGLREALRLREPEPAGR
ncbi:MAG TPA: glycosyltransferase [Thermoleophilaceae bacterium]|nr:glycosyltransferase [Thermoleophilaceae bacterium]